MMESWCYSSEGKGGVLLSDELDSRTDCISRSRKVYTGWDFKGTGNYQNGLPVDSQGFMELGFAGNVRKTLSDDPMNGLSSSKIANGRVTPSSSTHYPNTFFGEVSIIDSDSRDSSLIDLKLGRLADSKDGMSGKSVKEIRALSSIISPVPVTKRARSASLNGHTPFCQVHGCNMDLSSSKDYHKRHRVCEIHSKTAKVIVNGIEQRFCQQCSRFHLLAEFDDGKRSCRKRLAGHNERRRKPQIDNHSGRTGKLLPPNHAGGRFMGTSFPARASFFCPDIFPGGVFREVKAENSNWCRQVKVEDAEIYGSTQTAVPPTTNNHMFPRNANPSLPGFDATRGSMYYENNCNRYAQDFSSSHSIQWQPIHITSSSGTEEFSVSDLTSTVSGLSGVPHSGCALSLLSSQSQKMHPSGIPMARPLVIQGGLAHYNETQFPDKLLMAVNSQASPSVASNRFSSSGMSSMEDDHMGAVLVSDASNTIDFEGHADGLFHGCSDFMNVKDPISREHGQTVDLLQLSSQLRSAENQRRQVQAKRENEAFCYLNKS